MQDRFRVGVISSVHGIHGECKVFPTTDDMTRFKKLKKVYAVTRKGETELHITSVKFVKNMVVCKFEGIDTPEEIQKLREAELYIDREDAVELHEDEYYVADLIGLEVKSDEGEHIGKISDIWPTGANQVMEVTMDSGRKVLFPYIKQCILNVDLENQIMTVHVLDGLMDM